MQSILINRINIAKEIIACLEDQIKRESEDDFFGINEVLVQSLKNKLDAKLNDYAILMNQVECYNQKAA